MYHQLCFVKSSSILELKHLLMNWAGVKDGKETGDIRFTSELTIGENV